jgi:tetratricopeptide (TPR) repeat protein
MFKKLFGGTAQGSNYQAGKDLFERGMKAALEYRTAEAIELYSKSFELSPNPSPLINRAKLYRWRLLFEQSIRDLEMAKRLDEQQGDQFARSIGKELDECRFLAQNRLSGNRDLFVTDLRKKGFDYVAGRLADTIFEGQGSLLGYHVLNELDNLSKFENLADFPSARHLLQSGTVTPAMINSVIADLNAQRAFDPKGQLFQMMICVYDYPDMSKLRDLLVKKIWELMNSRR